MQYENIEYIEQINRQCGSYWFSKGSKQFFSSRVSNEAIIVDNTAYFVSSEQFKPSYGHPYPRKYTARVMDMTTGHVSELPDTVFQQFSGSRAAWAAIKRYLKPKGQK